jgi:hypothetical protein
MATKGPWWIRATLWFLLFCLCVLNVYIIATTNLLAEMVEETFEFLCRDDWFREWFRPF